MRKSENGSRRARTRVRTLVLLSVAVVTSRRQSKCGSSPCGTPRHQCASQGDRRRAGAMRLPPRSSIARPHCATGCEARSSCRLRRARGAARAARRCDASKGSKPWKIGFTNSYAGNDARQEVIRALKEDTAKYKKLGLVSGVTITLSNGNVTTHINQIDQLVRSGVNAIMDLSETASGTAPAINRAVKAGVVFVTMDQPVTAPGAVNVSTANWCRASSRPAGWSRNWAARAASSWWRAFPVTGSEIWQKAPSASSSTSPTSRSWPTFRATGLSPSRRPRCSRYSPHIPATSMPCGSKVLVRQVCFRPMHRLGARSPA